MQAPPEKLGSFYLGAEYDLDGKQRLDLPVSYDARDLTTHGVCVGMTGSGKTGLCIGLLEEAAIDKIPTLMIDPKGDITNLLLQFPDLLPEDFEPWVNVDDARRKGRTVAEHAAATADMWRDGLADWGQGPERLRLLQEAGHYTIYTPGSDAGVPVNILGSLAAPQLDFDSNAELIRGRIGGTVAAMLSLAGLKADPVRSREAILLSNIFEHFWKQGEDLDLTKLIMAIQNPPVRQMGVFDVDTFFPEADRFDLAMDFNTLVASPTFSAWLQGETLDIDALMYTADGQPRHAIFYIAHLSDSERMFFVTLLLENLLTWMRRQPGTTSLRALLYFDEIFGFFPPTAEPPSKRPLLTLLKQARAFGLGAMLVTQNPVDLDYKGLTNAGTWFIGKLQAERDKARVLEGLKGAIAEAGGRGEHVDFDTMLSQLGNRVFLLHNVHADGPVVFQTRWALSYLRGPLTKPQVRQLMAERTSAAASSAAPAPAAVAIDNTTPTSRTPEGYSTHPPSLPSASQVFLPIEVAEQSAVQRLIDEQANPISIDNVALLYEPTLIGSGTVRFVNAKYKVNTHRDQTLVARLTGQLRGVKWDEADSLPYSSRDLQSEPEAVGEGQGPYFASLPEDMNAGREIKELKQSFSDWLYDHSRYPLLQHATLQVVQLPDEDERAFKIRVQQAAREARDDEVDKLEAKYAKVLDRLEDKLRKKETELDKDEAKYSARQREEITGIGESVLGFFSRRRRKSVFSKAMDRRRLTGQARSEVDETQSEIEDIEQEIAQMKQELAEAGEAISTRWDEAVTSISTVEIKPRRIDVEVGLAGLGWLSHWYVTYRDGETLHNAIVEAYKPVVDS